jgi:uncharacterized membrane protein
VEDLASRGRELDVDLYVLGRPGALVGPGHPLLLASRTLVEAEEEGLRKPFVVGPRRTFEADPRFGFVVLSEIAARALSPAVNDPGTAIDVITTSTRLLCEWSEATAQDRPDVHHPRLHVRPVTVEHLLEDAFRWIARNAAGSAEVQIWLLKNLRMLVAQDPDRLGPPACAMAREVLARAEQGLTFPGELDEVRRVAREVENG